MKYTLAAVGLALIGFVGIARADLENPVPVRTVAPEFPSEMRRQHVSGVVFVSCEIDAQGNVSDAKVVKSTNDAFTEPAVTAVKKWKFKPAHKDGTAVSVRVSIPVKFTIED